MAKKKEGRVPVPMRLPAKQVRAIDELVKSKKPKYHSRTHVYEIGADMVIKSEQETKP